MVSTWCLDDGCGLPGNDPQGQHAAILAAGDSSRPAEGIEFSSTTISRQRALQQLQRQAVSLAPNLATQPFPAARPIWGKFPDATLRAPLVIEVARAPRGSSSIGSEGFDLVTIPQGPSTADG